MAAAPMEKTPGARYRESSASRWRQNLLAKVGLAACRWKANEEVRLVERKVCFISEAGSQGQGAHIQRPTPPQPQSVDKNFYRQREQAPCVNSTVSSDGRLETGHR